MKKQKKTLSVVLATILAFTLCVSLCVTSAFAGTIGVSGAVDGFDGDTIDQTQWAEVDNDGGTFSKLVQRGSMRIENAPANSYAFTQNKVGEDGKDLQVEFDVLKYVGGGNILFMMGVNEELSASMSSRGNSFFQLGADNRALKGGAEAFKGYYLIEQTTWYDSNSWANVGIRTNYRYQFYFFANGEFKLSVKSLDSADAEWLEVVRNYGDNVNAAAKFTGVGNGRVGFWFDGVISSLEIDNFSATAVNGDGTKDMTDDFEGATLSAENWEVGDGIKGGSAYAMKAVSAAAATQAKFLSKTIKVDVGSKEHVSSTVAYELTVNSIGADGAFITYFGLDKAEAFAATDSNVSLKITASGTNLALTATEKGGDALRITDAVGNTSTTLVLGDTASFAKAKTISYTVVNNGLTTDIEVYVSGVKKGTVKYVSANGYFGFGAMGELNVSFDNVTTYGVDYAISQGADQFIDFDNELDTEKWSLESPDETSMSVKDGKLVFNNGKTGCYFGSTSKYSNFDLSFDISDISYERVIDDENDTIISDVSTWIGVCFARETLDSTFIESNLVYVDNNPWNGPSGNAADAKNGRGISMFKGALGPISYDFPNLYSKESNAAGGATIRVTAVNGTVSLYVRPMNAPLYYLETPVLVIENVKTDGYVSLCCTEGAYFKIDNLYIRNIDSTGLNPDVTVNTKSVVLDKTSLTLTEGNTAKISATVTPTYATEQGVLYTTSDESIASVAADGTVTAKKAGNVTITVSAKDGSISAQCTVKVEAKVEPPKTSSVEETSSSAKKEGCGAITVSMLGAALASVAAAAYILIRKK